MKWQRASVARPVHSLGAMDATVTFSQDEVLEIREQYVARIETLERQNEELELMLRRALAQVRAVEELIRRASTETTVFEEQLVKLVDDCEVVATTHDVEKLRARRPASPASPPKVVVSDVPRPVAPPPIVMRSPRSIYTAEAISGQLPIPPVPAVRVAAPDQEVSDDMVVEDNGLTVVAAKVPMPPPVLSSPMPGAPRGALSALVARAQRNAPARRLVS